MTNVLWGVAVFVGSGVAVFRTTVCVAVEIASGVSIGRMNCVGDAVGTCAASYVLVESYMHEAVKKNNMKKIIFLAIKIPLKPRFSIRYQVTSEQEVQHARAHGEARMAHLQFALHDYYTSITTPCQQPNNCLDKFPTKRDIIVAHSTQPKLLLSATPLVRNQRPDLSNRLEAGYQPNRNPLDVFSTPRSRFQPMPDYSDTRQGWLCDLWVGFLPRRRSETDSTGQSRFTDGFPDLRTRPLSSPPQILCIYWWREEEKAIPHFENPQA